MRRAKLRFGLLTGAVALLVFLIIFQQTLAGALLGFFTGGLEHQSAEVLVYGEDARRNVEGSRILPGTLEEVAAVEGVGSAAPLAENTFTVRAGGELQDAALFDTSSADQGMPTRLSEGRLPQTDGEAVASSVDAGNGFGSARSSRSSPAGTRSTSLAWRTRAGSPSCQRCSPRTPRSRRRPWPRTPTRGTCCPHSSRSTPRRASSPRPRGLHHP